jgi:polyferredoxin
MSAPLPLAQRLLKRLASDSQTARRLVQGAFVVLCLWIGVEFFLFMRWARDMGMGEAPYVPHPSGAEGFLPISALMSLRLWAETGQVHPVHPAALFILVAILAIGLLFKKAFCSWICPIGTLSEALGNLGRRLLGRNLAPPRWLDLPLRGIKYLLLLFFLWAIVRMDLLALEAFLDGPYNRVADLRMYQFFAHMSALGLGVIGCLALLSVLVRGFWCRYLCPYGALLGSLSLLGPLRVTRRASTCIDCRRCTRACPSRIQVHQARRVHSDECTGCYRCVQACPVKDTLGMRPPVGKALPGWLFGILVVGLFLAVTGAAMLLGFWRTSVTPEEYRHRVPEMESYRHH